MTEVLPHGVSEAALSKALDRFVAALGPDAVFTDEEQLRAFRDPFTFAMWDDHWGAAVLQPETVEQVQEIVRIANELQIPLWTSSQGNNNAYGGAAPVLRGSVQINLRRMNRVLEVNEALGYAVVEPGVSFFDLYHHLRAHGHKLWPQLPDISWGSVIGNTVDHGIGVGRPGQHADRAAGMEVVLADGEILRTGMGALPGSGAWHAYKRGFGPALDPIFMQSNFGIVTKMGVWLVPEPETYRLGTIAAEGEDGLKALVDGIRPFVLDGTIEGGLALTSGVDTRQLVALREAIRRGDGPTAEEGAAMIKQRVRERAGHFWSLRWGMYGPPDVIDAQWAHIQRGFAGVAGVEFGEVTYRGADVHTEAANHAEKCSAGVANDELLALVDLWEGVGGHLDFSPTAPLNGADAVALTKLLRPIFEDAGLLYNPTFSIVGRTMFHVVPTFFDTSDEAQVRAAFDELFPKALAATAAAGYGLYRTHVHFMEAVMDTYSFNDHVLRRFLETIKDAVDPNGVLSPGKSGIWPQRLRPERASDELRWS